MSERASFLTRPYVGLIPFREEDAHYFFGREKEQEIITANLLAARLTLLYGPSGVGKSSVLRAGVAYQLQQLSRQNMARRGRPKFAVTFFNDWRADPLRGLLAQVEASVRQTLAGQVIAPVAPTLSFVESLQEWSKRVQGQLLIILDQFEEYFLYHPNEDGAGTFAVEFPRAVNAPGLSVNFVVSYRDDAHAQLDFFKGRIPNLFDNYLRIGYLNHEAGQSAIEKPIEQYNKARPTNQSQIEIEDGLVAAVLTQVRAGEKYIGEAGRGVVSEPTGPHAQAWEIETPYLQLVMTRLWDEEMRAGSHVLRLATLNALGGARRIVQTHLDNAMSALSGSERAMGASVFNYLVTPSGTKIAQTVPDLTEYANLSPAKEAQLGSMMKALTEGDRRILRVVPSPPNQPDAPCYEVFHDVLAQAIIDWRRRYRTRQERRRLWAYISGMAVLLLLMTGLTAFAFVERSHAQRAAQGEVQQREAAQQSAQLAAEQAQLAVRRAREADVARATAEHAETKEAEQKNKAEQAARQNEELAAKNKQLAQRATAEAQHAIEQARLAEKNKLEAEAQRNVAVKALSETEAAKKIAEARRREAEEAKNSAENALALVNEVDSSVPYFKAIMRGHEAAVNLAIYSPNGEFVVTFSGYGDEAPHVWNADTGALKAVLNDACEKMAVAISPDSKYIATGCHTEVSGFDQAHVWDAATGHEITIPFMDLDFDIKGARSVAFSPDSKFIVVTALNLSTAAVLPITDNQKPGFLLRGHTESIESAVYSPDGKYILTISDDNTARVWKASGGESVATLSLSGFFPIAFSPQGKYLIMGSSGYTVHVLVVNTGQILANLKHEDSVSSIKFSDDEKYVVTASGETARVWDVQTGYLLATLGDGVSTPNPGASPTAPSTVETRCETRGHQAPLSSAAFSPDGKYVVTASADKTALVWDWQARKAIAPLRGHTDAVLSAVFDKSGKYVLTASADRTARVWEVFSTASTVPSREVTIKSNNTFDFENGTSFVGLVGNRGDAWWEQTGDTIRRLVPHGETRLANIGPLSSAEFDKLSLTELQGLNYSNSPLSGNNNKSNQLFKGNVFAVMTAGDKFFNYSKVQVLEYGDNLKIRWVTYRKDK
ncbi:MAG: hypothetical protein ACJ74W_20580 [Pyrinomonadaceae bacterium]